MNVLTFKTSRQMGEAAARHAARVLNAAIAEKGRARMVLSTGASQFDTLSALAERDVDWTKVEMFHLDEYVGLPDTHPASFTKYLRERFVQRLPAKLKAAHFVAGLGDLKAMIADLTRELRSAPIDLGLIGVGENTHIAFNDPPADFDTREAYFIVTLDERCKRQQMGEGWFPTIDDVPEKAVSMTPFQIMQCAEIISAIPYKVKADAVSRMMKAERTTNLIPATLLKEHRKITVYLDEDSASLL